MSVAILILRHVLGRTSSYYLHICRMLFVAFPLFLLSAGGSAAVEQGDEWSYWRFGVTEEKSYLSQYRPLKTVPPMPQRNYHSHKKHHHKYDRLAGGEVTPRRKKTTKHVYSEARYKEEHDYEGSDEQSIYASSHDESDENYAKDHHKGGYRFGRLFPGPAEREKYEERGPSMRALKALGLSMVEEGPENDPIADSEQPAGYTFFGQFIDHDITFETKTQLGREISGDYELQNARTPDLDLDSVYGGGPRRTPHLFRLPYIRVGRLISERGSLPRYDLFRTKSSYRDGPSGGQAVALLGDPRNDENIILSQLHAAFVAFHNRTVDILVERDHGHARSEYCEEAEHCTTNDLALSLPEEIKAEIFQTARDHVIYYYHRLILDDFLPRTIGPSHTLNLLKHKRDFFFPDGFSSDDDKLPDLYIPVEFSLAFRYGHSQVRDSYVIREGERFELLSDGRDGSPRAFEPVRPRHLVDWHYFFEIGNDRPRGFNFARKIDPELVSSLHRLHFSNAVEAYEEQSLAARNLIRGKGYHLPSGQTIAKLILPRLEERGLLGQSEETREDYHGGLWRAFLLPQDDRIEHFLGEVETPFWYYIVQEAQRFGLPTHLRALPSYRRGRHHYSRENDYEGHYKGHFRRASFEYDNREEDEGHYRYDHYRGGHRLGPVGAAIVGEVLIGMMEHYAKKTGKGLNYEPQIRGSMSELAVLKGNSKPKRRYLMRNFLIDAGVVEKAY